VRKEHRIALSSLKTVRSSRLMVRNLTIL
jgi:hypothetical protein